MHSPGGHAEIILADESDKHRERDTSPQLQDSHDDLEMGGVVSQEATASLEQRAQRCRTSRAGCRLKDLHAQEGQAVRSFDSQSNNQGPDAAIMVRMYSASFTDESLSVWWLIVEASKGGRRLGKVVAHDGRGV